MKRAKKTKKSLDLRSWNHQIFGRVFFSECLFFLTLICKNRRIENIKENLNTDSIGSYIT